MSKKLQKFYDFFEKSDSERYRGMDESYFENFNEFEKGEAWEFFLIKFELSEESINGLYILNKQKAVDLFKNAISKPHISYQYRAQKLEAQRCGLLMLKYILRHSLEREYLLEMTRFATSEFKEVRADFAEFVPFDTIIPETVDALKAMIFVEAERAPLSSAIAKLMRIYGMDFDIDDATYKSIYLALRSGDANEKTSAIKYLEKLYRPVYI